LILFPITIGFVKVIAMIIRVLKIKKALKIIRLTRLLVQKAGLEPARPLLAIGF
jgi:hypothetical protein